MKENITLKDLPKEDLPRERLLTFGAQNLSDVELISIILRTGTLNTSAKDLATIILSRAGSINNLKYMTIQKMNEIKGLGYAKGATLLAALELGRRVYDENKVIGKIRIYNSLDAFKYFAKYIINEFQENFMVVYLDNQKQYINHKILFKGTINSSIVHPREILKEALLSNATSIIIMHNHPSGILTPSTEDDETTKSILESGKMMGISLLDHLIVGGGDYYSYNENGRGTL